MADQHDAHCYILQETWPKPAKGKKRTMVMHPRKIVRITKVNGLPAIALHTNGFVSHMLWIHELIAGQFRIMRI